MRRAASDGGVHVSKRMIPQREPTDGAARMARAQGSARRDHESQRQTGNAGMPQSQKRAGCARVLPSPAAVSSLTTFRRLSEIGQSTGGWRNVQRYGLPMY